MPSFSAGFDAIGGAVADIFAAKGNKIAAKGYSQAAAFSEQNADLQQVAGRIREIQAKREAYRIIGGQQADVAGAGFAKSGTALDLLRSSQQEAALELGVLSTQTAINVNEATAAAAGYRSQAKSKKTEAKGNIFGAVLKGVAAAAFIFSDRRLKRNIKRIGTADNGLPIYSFQYWWGRQTFIGFMADEVAKIHPEAVTEDERGYLMVDYARAVEPANA